MSVRRTSAVLTMVALLASILSVAGVSNANAAPPASAGQQPALVRAAVAGQPPANYVIPATSFYSFPNRTKTEKGAIRNRVYSTIRSVWGGPKTPAGNARNGNGTIRMATWSFNDWGVARALVNARERGVSVQIVGAKSANTDFRPWKYLKRKLGHRLYQPGHPGTRDTVSFARECRGSCRGAGGTPHAKYFMFDNVGSRHVRNVVVQSSMNLTKFAVEGQWNQAEVSWSKAVYAQFMGIFRQTRIGRAVSPTYRRSTAGSITNIFFPLPRGRASNDPVMRALNQTSCTRATAGGNANRRTKIRIINYAIYGDRGTWIAKKLRNLWSRGCDIKILYAVSSRPVVSILRSASGRGRIPMKQSVITNGRREIVKYNHSKWMTITGRWGGSSGTYMTMSGSANWSAFAFTGDEQIQQIRSRTQAIRHNSNFNKTWTQKSSHAPGFGTHASEARMLASIPVQPTFGKGIYKYLTPNGG